MPSRPDLAARNRSVRRGNTPYEDREWLRTRYEDQEMTLREIAAEVPCGLRTVARWMRIHSIPTRKDDWRSQAQRMRETRGPLHWNWKGGRHVDRGGYVHVLVPVDWPWPEMVSDSAYIMEHRKAMAEALGRALESSETVHHIDGNRQNNQIGNLQLRRGNHGSGVAMVCADCGSHNIVTRPLASPRGGDALCPMTTEL